MFCFSCFLVGVVGLGLFLGLRFVHVGWDKGGVTMNMFIQLHAFMGRTRLLFKFKELLQGFLSQLLLRNLRNLRNLRKLGNKEIIPMWEGHGRIVIVISELKISFLV